MRLLVVGANGQVGRELRRSLPRLGEVVGATREGAIDTGGACRAVDLSDPHALAALVRDIAPSAVVGSLGARAGLYESAAVRVHPTGSISVMTGTHSHGQGHETTFAQIVSDTLGVPIENVDIVHGDTAKVPFGMGTYGSRSLAVGGSALVKALDKVVKKSKRIAAHLPA